MSRKERRFNFPSSASDNQTTHFCEGKKSSFPQNENNSREHELMIEKLPRMPTGCHTSPFQEITAVRRADRDSKMAIKCILIKLFYNKAQRNLKTKADYYPSHAY
ncbi:hypothetical protein KIL84_013252 [Mauremys mutica]|uniref:Uncharacterized protein n=1 Tax=Mauremys mutica TaxID=74926 RepID=A0A9D3WX35_9SAUR|nr:hypothetical protein KIL84_013252 [Mauremys mutica]